MSRKCRFGRHYFLLLLMAAAGVATTMGDRPGCQAERRELQRMGEKFKKYQKSCLMALRDIFINEEDCPACPKFDKEVEIRLEKAKAGMEMRTRALIAVATTPVSERKAAQVPHPSILAAVNTSQTLSCESAGKPLVSCVWSRTVDGRRTATVVDDAATQLGGVSYFGHELKDGKCSARIQSMTTGHFGTWSCVLVGENGAVFNGEVKVSKALAAEPEPTIYFATHGGGLKAFSMETLETSTAVSTAENLNGVAYDFQRDLIYWSSNSKIYRKPSNGSRMTTVLRTTQGGNFKALDYDWVTANLYVSTYHGNILACHTRMTSSLRCASLVTGQHYAIGIAVNPIEGLMFWTSYGSHNKDGSVSRAGMDGWEPSVIVTGLYFPHGIAIDFQSLRLYWAAGGYDNVYSSNLEGTDLQVVIQVPGSEGTFGIALHGSRIYCTSLFSKKFHHGRAGLSRPARRCTWIASSGHNFQPFGFVPEQNKSLCESAMLTCLCTYAQILQMCALRIFMVLFYEFARLMFL